MLPMGLLRLAASSRTLESERVFWSVLISRWCQLTLARQEVIQSSLSPTGTWTRFQSHNLLCHPRRRDCYHQGRCRPWYLEDRWEVDSAPTQSTNRPHRPAKSLCTKISSARVTEHRRTVTDSAIKVTNVNLNRNKMPIRERMRMRIIAFRPVTKQPEVKASWGQWSATAGLSTSRRRQWPRSQPYRRSLWLPRNQLDSKIFTRNWMRSNREMQMKMIPRVMKVLNPKKVSSSAKCLNASIRSQR